MIVGSGSVTGRAASRGMDCNAHKYVCIAFRPVRAGRLHFNGRGVRCGGAVQQRKSLERPA